MLSEANRKEDNNRNIGLSKQNRLEGKYGGVKMSLTKRKIEKQYNVVLSRDNCTDSGKGYWISTNAPIGSNEYDDKTYIDGWTLNEIAEKLQKTK